MIAKSKHRVLVLGSSDASVTQHWQLPHISLCRSTEGNIPNETFDAIIVSPPDQKTLEHWLQTISEMANHDPVPTLLCVNNQDPLALCLPGRHLDGYIDPSWPMALIEAYIESAFHRVLAGKNVVEIQKVLLSEAHGNLDQLHQLAAHDDLTQLYNRRQFERIIAKEHARCERYERTYALLFLDLDGLKAVNTQYGHIVGGQVLVAVGNTIALHTRGSDTAFRFGGDEFVILMVEGNKKGATYLANILCEAIRLLSIEVPGGQVSVTASIGIAAYPDDHPDANGVVHAADLAVYEAKARGKNQVVIYDNSLASTTVDPPP